MEDLYFNEKSLLDIEGEVWSPVFGYEDFYEVSNLGRVKSLERIVEPVGRVSYKTKERIMSQCKIKHEGETQFSLYVKLTNENKESFTKTVASLVLNSFKKPDEYNNHTHHINGFSHDNRLLNLTFEDLHYKRQIEFIIGVRDKEKYRKVLKKIRPTPKTKSELLKLKSKNSRRPKRYRQKKNNPVTVFIEKDNSITSYSCLRNASDQLGIKEYTLRNALKKPEKYTYIQVKYGCLSIEDFSPKKRKKIKKVLIKGDMLSISEISKKYCIKEPTLYYNLNKKSEEEFIKFVEKKITI